MSLRHWLPLVILLCASRFVLADALDDALSGSRCERYRQPAEQQLLQAQSLFRQLLSDTWPDADRLRSAWTELGYRWESITVDGVRFWLAHESGPDCRGHGVYLFRADSRSELVLQIPHRYADRGTGDIGLAVVRAVDVRVATFNTTPRYNNNDDQDEHVVDVAHAEANYFSALARAVAHTRPQAWLVQLHGFASAKRRTPAGQGADMILSAGVPWPGAAVRTLRDCLEPLAPDAVRLYATEVDELGATRNAQGRVLRAAGHPGFMHIEMSERLRERLLGNAAHVAILAECLCTR